MEHIIVKAKTKAAAAIVRGRLTDIEDVIEIKAATKAKTKKAVKLLL